MDNGQLLSIINSFNITPDGSTIVKLHLNNRGICTGEDALDRGTEITRICHIANIINIVRLGAIESVDDDPVGVFRKHMLDGTDRFFIPYDFIAFYIFNDSCEYEADMVEEAYEDIINTSNTTFFEDQKNEGKPVDEDLKNNIETIFKKIQRHILLSIHQKQYILENIDQAQREVELLNEDIFTLTGTTELLQAQSNSMREQADSFINRLQNVTGTYVAILGIFATIIFAVVGGINLLGSAAEYIRYKKEFLLYVSVGVLTLSLIIYFLFSWIYRLRGHEGSSDNQQAHNGWLRKVELFFKNYGFFLFLSVLSGIAIYAFLSDDQKLNRPIGNIPSGYFEDAPFHYLGVWDRTPNEISTIRIDNKE